MITQLWIREADQIIEREAWCQSRAARFIMIGSLSIPVEVIIYRWIGVNAASLSVADP